MVMIVNWTGGGGFLDPIAGDKSNSVALRISGLLTARCQTSSLVSLELLFPRSDSWFIVIILRSLIPAQA